jgi:hypothetical protein
LLLRFYIPSCLLSNKLNVFPYTLSRQVAYVVDPARGSILILGNGADRTVTRQLPTEWGKKTNVCSQALLSDCVLTRGSRKRKKGLHYITRSTH